MLENIKKLDTKIKWFILFVFIMGLILGCALSASKMRHMKHGQDFRYQKDHMRFNQEDYMKQKKMPQSSIPNTVPDQPVQSESQENQLPPTTTPVIEVQ